MAAKKNRGRPPSTKYITHYFTTKKTRRCSYTVALPSSEQQQEVPVKIEGVRLRKSRWIAEIKHPDKKYVRMWLGSYATPEEASQVYQSKKMEFEDIKFRATMTKDKKLVGDEEAEAEAESSPDVTIKDKNNIDDQAMEEVVFDNQEAMRAVDFNVLEESKAGSLLDVNLVGFDDRATKVVDYQGEKSLGRGKVVEQEIGDMLMQLGPVSINKYGYILGEFSWMDDLSITS